MAQDVTCALCSATLTRNLESMRRHAINQHSMHPVEAFPMIETFHSTFGVPTPPMGSIAYQLTDHDFENMRRIVEDDCDGLGHIAQQRLIDEVRRLRVFEAAVRKLCEVEG